MSYFNLSVGEDVNHRENEELEAVWVRLRKIQKRNLGNQQHVDISENKPGPAQVGAISKAQK